MYTYAITLTLRVPNDLYSYINEFYYYSPYQPLVGIGNKECLGLDYIIKAPSSYDAYNNVIVDVMRIIPNAIVVNKIVQRLDNNNE
jgi:hypothetical protein